jgi:O-antigen/teichoic acid export membrane protein
MTETSLNVEQYHGLAKNGIWVMVSNISMVFVMALTVIASRLLGDDAFGQYTFLLAVATLLAELSVLGTTDYVAIIVAREPERTGELVANTLAMRLPFSLLFLAVFMLVAWMSMPAALIPALLIALDWVVRTIIHLLRGVFRARNVYRWDAQAATVERLSVLVCAALALLIKPDLLIFALGFLVGRLIGLAACIITYYRLGEKLRLSFSAGTWRSVLQGGTPIGVRGMLKGVSFRIDAAVLGLLRASEEVGWYGAAYKLLEAGFSFQEAVGASFQPAISRAYGNSDQRLIRDLYGRGYKILLILGGAIVAGGFLFADEITLLLFGDEYRNSAFALRVLIWAMPLIFASNTSIALLDAVGSQKRTVWFFGASVLLNLILNAFLIPRSGYLGAAWSTVITELFLAFGLLVLSFRSGYTFPRAWLLGPVVAVGAFIGFSLVLAFSPILSALIGSAAFLVVLLLSGVFDELDFQYGKKIILKLNRR